MNGLDWALAAIALFCLLRGIMRGAISQVFGIGGLIVGFLVAAHYHQAVAGALGTSFPNLSSAPAISFALLFFLTWFCLGVMGYILSSLLKKTGLGFVDRAWGGAVGLGKALVLSIVIISAMTFFLPGDNELLRHSRVTPHVQEAAVLLVNITPQSVQQVFREKKKQLELYWSQRHRDSKGQPENISSSSQREALNRP